MGKIKSGVALGSPGLADMKPSRPSLQLLTVWRRRPRTCTHTHTLTCSRALSSPTRVLFTGWFSFAFYQESPSALAPLSLASPDAEVHLGARLTALKIQSGEVGVGGGVCMFSQSPR